VADKKVAAMKLASTSGSAGARILGLGHYRPANVVTNHDLIARGVDTDDAWIKSRVGIAERRWADPDETIVDMAEAAGSKALANSGMSPEDVDFVLVATSTMPSPIPAAAPELASRLGIRAPGAYDVSSGCSGFVYALSAAEAAVRTGQARNVLVVASERFSGWLDMTDRSTCIILADGAGAAVVGPAEETGLGPVVWGSDGGQSASIVIDAESRFFRQEGPAVYRWATSQMAPVALEACRRAGVEPSELAAFVPHQANLRIIDAIAKHLGATNAVIARDIVTSGNTSGATIPLALSRLVEQGEVPSGAPALLLGFGSGLAYAGQVVLTP
jgi:3-oxoacyl-[acyl-carrier-protein] synthase-3